MRETVLEWYTPEDEPMAGAECLLFYSGELYKVSYDGSEFCTFSSAGRLMSVFALEAVDAWAYAPKANEVLGEHLSYDECAARAPAEDAALLSFDEWNEIHGGDDD